MNDHELLRRYLNDGSQGDFAQLVERHVNLVYSAANRLVHDPHLAEDVVQQTFVLLARKAGQLGSDTILSAWLYRTARHLASETLRREGRRLRREQLAVETMTLSTSEVGWTQIAPLLDEAMTCLNRTDHDALVLRYFENKSLNEVGEALGFSDDTAQKRVSRAVEKLRTFFAKRGVAVGASSLAVVLSANAVQAAPAGLAATLTTAALAGTATAATTTTATTAIAMTTMQKTIIGATLAAAVSTGIYEAHRASTLREQNQALQQQQAPLTEQIQHLTGENSHLSKKLAMSDNSAVNKRFKWESLESTDYKQYIANLRAIGCPEQTIRDIIVTDVERTYAQRMAKSYPSARRNYWEDSIRPVAHAQKNVEYTSIEVERDRVIRDLLGIDAHEEYNRRAGLPVPYEEGFEFLSAEKRRQLREISNEGRLEEIADEAATLTGQGRDRSREIEEWREAEIKKLLTPEELNEYELRKGEHRNGLALMARAFEPSEQEFRTIFQVEKQFGKDDYNWVLGTTGYAQRKPADAETEQRFQSALKQALGDQRYAEYQRSLDPNYLILYDIARDDGLPKDTMLKAYELNRAAEQQAAAIQTDASLSVEARQAALRQLEEQKKNDITKLLGKWGFTRYRSGQQDAVTSPSNRGQ